jgi:hypothetical protein
MRDRRLLRAEEAANKLSVKMILPLGLFIFPEADDRTAVVRITSYVANEKCGTGLC